jgi:chaperone required for assembly of F1-ATPase
LETELGIKLKLFENIASEPEHSETKKIIPILENLDPFVLVSLYTITVSAKSSGIALALMMNKNLSVEDAVKISRVDENYQASHFGRVEGAHDFDEAQTLTTFATAKSVVNLCQLREF